MPGILRNKLPPNMKTSLWLDFLDVTEEESELAKEEIRYKESLINIQSMDYDSMIEISSILGIPVDASVDASEEFLRREVKSAAFRIRWKASAKLYKSFFQAFKRHGSVYLYYYSGSNLVRDAKNIFSYLDLSNLSEPYYQRSTENFSGFIREENKLDSGLKLDEDWKIDNKTSKKNTKHIAVEVIIDTLYYSGGDGLAPALDLAPSELLAPSEQVVFLIDNSYFSYLLTNVEASKKACEVLHVGCQLSAVVDNSRIYNSLGFDYTMPKIALNGVTTDSIATISTVSNMYYIEFGIGKKSLPSFGGSEPQPTELTEKLAKVPIIIEEKYENSDWYGVSGEYIGCLINDKLVATGDGTTTSFSTTLLYSPIKKGNVKITFVSSSITYSVHDDYFGNLIGDNAIGTINYETGYVTLDTSILYEQEETLGTGTGSQTYFEWSASKVIEQILITYIINGTTYIATDNGSGIITGIQCTGTVTYSTGDIALTFGQAPANGTLIIVRYKFEKITIPDSGTKILAEYYFTSSIVNITEAGVTDFDGNLLAYATFPQLQFSSFKTHLNMNFIIKKTNF